MKLCLLSAWSRSEYSLACFACFCLQATSFAVFKSCSHTDNISNQQWLIANILLAILLFVCFFVVVECLLLFCLFVFLLLLSFCCCSFCVVINTSLIPSGNFRSPYLGQAMAATKAVLPIPTTTSKCNIFRGHVHHICCCMRLHTGLYGHTYAGVCTKRWLWKKNSLSHQGIKPVSVLHLPLVRCSASWATPHPFMFYPMWYDLCINIVCL